MNQSERRQILIRFLLKERPKYQKIEIPHNGNEQKKLMPVHRRQLAFCYLSCLELADQNQVHSIAFCCISTGVFMFPNEDAAEIAIQTVKDYKAETGQ